MARRPRPAPTTPPLRSWHAVLLHPPHPMVETIQRQLQRLGLTVRVAWPALEPEDIRADVVLFDVDTGHDAQFPWAPGAAPMPLVALIGSEAAGRLEWALAHRFHSHLLKPVGAAGTFSALTIAAENFAEARRRAAEVSALDERLGRRSAVVGAVVSLMAGGLDEAGAMARLRALAMERRIGLEDAAEVVVAAGARAAARRTTRTASAPARSGEKT